MKSLILLVEDHAELIELTQRALEFNGYEVAAARNGLEAVELAALHVPDLILMDLFMPVMNGIEATSRIRNNPRTKDIPIVATTASAISEHKAQFLAAGCDLCLPKPYSFVELIDTIKRILGTGDRKAAQENTHNHLEMHSRPLITTTEIRI